MTIVLLVFALIVTDSSRNAKEAIRDFLWMTLMFTIIRFITYLVFGGVTMAGLYYAGVLSMMLISFATLYLGSGEDRFSTKERFSMFVVFFAILGSVWTVFYMFLLLIQHFILGGLK